MITKPHLANGAPDELVAGHRALHLGHAAAEKGRCLLLVSFCEDLLHPATTQMATHVLSGDHLAVNS